MRKSLTGYLYLSLAAAVATLFLKSIAFLVTGSVALMSDALESVVNFIAAFIALLLLRLAEKPPDEGHMYGHSKAEYFSSVFEGILIVIAAIVIIISAIKRIIIPQPIIHLNLGLIISTPASLINLFVALVLLRKGKQYHSITLEADARHLLTDVWTSAAVFIALILIYFTNLHILDPIFAIIAAINIIISGFILIKRSFMGFMDSTIARQEIDNIEKILKKYCQKGIEYHSLRTRQAAMRRFASVHILVPGNWTVQKGHQLLEKIEAEIRQKVPMVTIFTHLESLNDPSSWKDITIDRE